MTPLLFTAALLQPAPALDLYGDPLPRGALCRIGTTRLRPGSPVSAMAFTPDGKKLVTATTHSGVYVWDTATGKELHHLPHVAESLGPPAVSPDGVYVASFRGLNASVRKVATGEEVCSIGVQAWTAFILAVFAPDGKTLALLLHTGEVGFYDLPSGKLRHKHTIAAFDSSSFLVFAPDSQSVVVRGNAGTVARYEVATGKRVAVYRDGDETDEYTSVAFSADGKRLAGLTVEGKRVDVWDAATGKLTASFQPKELGPARPRFTPDGKHLLLSDTARNLCLWDLEAGKCVRNIPLGPGGWVLAVSHDGAMLAAGAYMVRLWRLADGKETPVLDVPQGWYSTAWFAPDGKAVLTSFPAAVYWWEAATGKQIKRVRGDDDERTFFDVSADGNVLAGAVLHDTRFSVRDGATRKILLRKQCQGHVVRQLQLSVDGKLVTVIWRGFDRSDGPDLLQVWEIAGDRLILEVPSPPSQWWEQFAQDGRRVCALCGDYEHRVFHTYDTATGRKLPRTSVAIDARGLALQSVDGRLLATSPTYVGTAIREVLTGNLIGLPKVDGVGLVHQAFSPDGRLLALGTGDGKVLLWDVIRGHLLTTFHGHRGSAIFLTFSPDGQRLLSGEPSGTLVVWDLVPWQTKTRRADVKLTAPELDALWADLASADGDAGWPALAKLVRAPEQAVALFKAKLRPSTADELAAIRALIAELGNDKFAVRQKASAELEKNGDLAAPLLEKALAGKPTLEVRQRVEKLLQKLETPPPPPECLRQLRALQALTMIGTPEARALLQALAEGDPDAWLTRVARAAGN